MSERPLAIGLVQINNSFSGQNYLPYSIGLLQAYVQGHAPDPSRYHFLMPIYKRVPIREIVDSLALADLVGFSTYVWNAQISLEAARRLKQQRPEILIVFGGPQVPDNAEPFMRAHRFIDVAVHNEGERTFLTLLEASAQRDWSTVPGVSYIDAEDRFHRTPAGPRIRDLAEVPSVFLNNVFDPLMKANPTENWIGLWETNRGCPFQCTFCDWGSATAGKVNQFELDRLYAEVDWFASRKIEYVFCCDANFGIFKRDLDIAKYVAGKKKDTGYPVALSVQNTKNATERAYTTQKILSDAGLNKGVALSMQSVDKNTLVNIKRDNIALETYSELQKRFNRDRVETYSDLILGLPGETYESFVDGVSMLIETGQHQRIQFNNLSILPNAEIANPEYRERHGITTVRTEIINFHGTREILDDDVPEYQDLVIATDTMPPEDWRRTRAFGWMANFLLFDKLLQMPLIVTHELSGISYRRLVEAFLEADKERFPVVGELATFFTEEAQKIQSGGAEYIYAPEWLGIFWPADEYMYIKLTDQKRLHTLYDDAGPILAELLSREGYQGTTVPIEESVKLNRALIHQPFQKGTLTIDLNYDILTFYQAVRRGDTLSLIPGHYTVTIDRDARAYDDFAAWCREIVWWGNKKGAYLYGSNVVGKELAGHY